MRVDEFLRKFQEEHWKAHTHLPAPSPYPAYDLQFLPNTQMIRGTDVMAVYGLLTHYTTQHGYTQIQASGAIGANRGGGWLTPTIYAACMAPYNLSLTSPRDVCLLVNVGGLGLWGPGTAGPTLQKSGGFPDQWYGGGIEFYSPLPIDIGRVSYKYEILPCGDRH